jgi:hypothetical protein
MQHRLGYKTFKTNQTKEPYAVIPQKNANDVTSTVQGNAVAMTIEDAAMGHIMNVLTNLYSDEELACIREYATNAYDAHREAGQLRPIEITLPTDLRPILSIRDYGPGLSANEIETIYSRYGASTKRESNDAVGMLGLGCKSALAYVDQFTLVSVKDGQRITVSVARDENGAGAMTINGREEVPDDEQSGVEVLIPAKRFNSFEDKAVEFFRYWEPGTVLVNGEEPEPLDGWKIDDEFTITDAPNSYDRKLRIVMGNVSYPVSSDYEYESAVLQSLPDGKQIIARVPIGMVSFTPSRESLQEHPATKAALDQILATFTDACTHAIKSQIAAAADKPAAAKVLIAARAALGAKNVPAVTFGGQIVPTVVSAEDLVPAGMSLWKNSPSGGYRGTASSRSPAGQISLDDAAKNPWIVNYTNANWSKTQRHKLNRYMEEHHPAIEQPGRRSIYITNAAAVPLSEWIDGNVLAIDWAIVREWKDPKKTSEGGSGAEQCAGTYPTYFHSAGRTIFRKKFAADELPKSGRNLYWCRNGAGVFQCQLGERAFIVELRSQREAKFLRLFPHARYAPDVMRTAAASWWSKLDDDAALAVIIGIHSDELEEFRKLCAGSIDDPQLSEALAAVDRWHGDKKLRDRCNNFSSYLNILDEYEFVLNECQRIAARYPLVGSMRTYSVTAEHYRHLLIYINAVYAAEKR